VILFHVDLQSGVPPYLQLIRQVRHELRTGALSPGDRLPTVKEVVASLAINPNTVAKAYRDLEHEGLVEGRQGVGTFVVRRPDGPPPAVLARLAGELAGWMTGARSAGLTDDVIQSLVDSAIRDSGKEGAA
jgi:DNA-binding transcriptional regulator YhcF (GntR family)